MTAHALSVVYLLAEGINSGHDTANEVSETLYALLIAHRIFCPELYQHGDALYLYHHSAKGAVLSVTPIASAPSLCNAQVHWPAITLPPTATPIEKDTE